MNFQNFKRTSILFMMIILSLTGCGHTPKVWYAQQEQTKLRVVTMFGGEDASAAVYQQNLAQFKTEHPEIMVEDESRTADEQWKAQIAADFAAGNEPDVLQFFTDATANQLVNTDKFVTIAEIRQEYPEYGKDVLDWALTQVANEDHVKRAIPTTGFWEGLYCNQDLFVKYDIPLPDDWDSLLYAIKEFQKHDIIPVACSLSSVPHYWMEYLLLMTAGQENYQRKEYTQVPLEWKKGLELFATLRKKGAFPKNTDSMDNTYAYELFNNKSAAMILEGNWFLPSVLDQENTVVIPFPGTAQDVLIGGMTTGFYITRRAWENPSKRDAAVQFVMLQTNQKAVQNYWEKSGGTAIAATKVFPMESRTNLEGSAWVLMEQIGKRVLPTDTRMSPEAYQTLISGIVTISDDGSAQELLEEVFRIQNEKNQ